MANYINLVFIIDESGSMYGSENDIVGGFNKLVEEQRAIEDGKCTVSLYTFNEFVSERFLGKDVSEVKKLYKGEFSFYKSLSDDYIIPEKDLYEYIPNGGTAMNDGIGKAIDNVGEWLRQMPEEERPTKNLIVIMTDGEENSSRTYSLERVQEMIKHQTEKYSWSFVYMGMDITNKKAAEDLGIQSRSFSAKRSGNIQNSYDLISNSLSLYRNCADITTAEATMDCFMTTSLNEMTINYEKEKGIKID